MMDAMSPLRGAIRSFRGAFAASAAAALAAANAAALLSDATPMSRHTPNLVLDLRNVPQLMAEFERRTRPFRKGKPRPWRTWRGCQRRAGR